MLIIRITFLKAIRPMYQRQVSFGQAVSLALGKNYCQFSGRSSRSEYWWFVLFQFIISSILSLFTDSDSAFGYIVAGVVNLALLLPGLGLCVRRMHDIGKSGWWILINFIPLVGNIIFIVWACRDSESDNEYGPVPNMTERRA